MTDFERYILKLLERPENASRFSASVQSALRTAFTKGSSTFIIRLRTAKPGANKSGSKKAERKSLRFTVGRNKTGTKKTGTKKTK
jgi:hypothetical protein